TYAKVIISRASGPPSPNPPPPPPAVRFARGIKKGCPGECSARLAEDLSARPANANTARPCIADTLRGLALATLARLSWSEALSCLVYCI
ncbi:hypothetical protein JG687_00019289, partial [Phytophthora cactorum]